MSSTRYSSARTGIEDDLQTLSTQDEADIHQINAEGSVLAQSDASAVQPTSLQVLGAGNRQISFHADMNADLQERRAQRARSVTFSEPDNMGAGASSFRKVRRDSSAVNVAAKSPSAGSWRTHFPFSSSASEETPIAVSYMSCVCHSVGPCHRCGRHILRLPWSRVAIDITLIRQLSSELPSASSLRQVVALSRAHRFEHKPAVHGMIVRPAS